MATTGDNPDALTTAALAKLQEGQYVAAESFSRRALSANRAHIGALTVLGLALHAQLRNTEAARVFTDLTRRDPNNRSNWINLGTTLRAERRYDEALAAYARAAQMQEDSPDFFYNVGLLHIDRGDYTSALSVLERAHHGAPADGEIAWQYAQCAVDCLRPEVAVAALQGWQQFRGLTSELASKIALLLLNIREPALAQGL